MGIEIWPHQKIPGLSSARSSDFSDSPGKKVNFTFEEKVKNNFSTF
jgi:hypothetical protein